MRWLREDPRYFQLMQARGRVEYWDSHGYPRGCSPVDGPKIDNVYRVSEWRMSALAAVITTATGEPMPSIRAMPQGDVPIETVPDYEPTASQSVIMAMSLLVTFDSSDLTYSTLVSTGGVRLLRNQELPRRTQAPQCDPHGRAVPGRRLADRAACRDPVARLRCAQQRA